MKRLFLLLISLMLIVVFLFSCSDKYEQFPKSSDNFSEEFLASFSDDYRFDDQLYYYSAYPAEVEFSCYFGYSNYARLALIQDTDKEDFVAWIGVNYGNMLQLPGPSYSTKAYAVASKDAPVPMSDWTISSVRLLSLHDVELTYSQFYSGTNETRQADFMRYAQSPVSDSAIELMRLSDKSMLQSVKVSYSNGIEPDRVSNYNEYYEYNKISDTAYRFTYYYFIVEFEENKNIFWCSTLFERDGSIYIHSEWTGSGTREYLFYKLDEEIAQQLRPYLPEPIKEEGAPENTSSSSTTATTTSTGQNTTSATTASTTK